MYKIYWKCANEKRRSSELFKLPFNALLHSISEGSVFPDYLEVATAGFVSVKVANHVVCLKGSRTLLTSNRTSRVRKIVHNFRYTNANFMR